MEWVDFVHEVIKGLCEDPRLIVERDDNHHIGISMMLTRPDHPKPWKSVALDVWAFEENKPSIQINLGGICWHWHSIQLRGATFGEFKMKINLNDQRQTDLLKECIGGIRVGGNQGFL